MTRCWRSSPAGGRAEPWQQRPVLTGAVRMADDELVCLHEAGHQAVAVAFGSEPGGLTVDGGQTLDGCSFHRAPELPPGVVEAAPAPGWDGRPFIAWPPRMRGALEAYVVILMAGQVAELMLAAPAPGARRLPAS